MLPSAIPKDVLPTSFLPQLPRPKNSLEPLSSVALLAHIGILRELYIPPIHGGFQATDVGHDSDAQVDRRTKVRERRFSASLTETMDSLGLGLDIDLGSAGASGAPKVDHAIDERPEEEEEREIEGETQDQEDEEYEEDEPGGHLDPFEREWAEKWLNGVVRRAQSWIEEHEEPEGDEEATMKDMEAILRDSTAVLAMMAGTSAAGSLTRHLLFPIHHSLAPGLKALQRTIPVDPSHSPTTTSFLASLSTSPTSPTIPFRASHSPTNSTDANGVSRSPDSARRHRAPSSPTSSRRRKRAAVPILLHDAPMQDHVSVGVQTWGSAILLGREMSLNPSVFGLFPGPSTPSTRGVRVLELGAGTGLLGILCRKLLDLRMASTEIEAPKYPGMVVATDYHHDVLANLKVCVDLNFPPRIPTLSGGVVPATKDKDDEGVKIAKLDWTTFPAYMAGRKNGISVNEEDNADVGQYVGESFDLVLASDCVYDPTHAGMLRQVAGWVLRLPDESVPGDIGGTFHLLSPIRPTFTPELESIDETFPTLSSYRSLRDRRAAAASGGEVEDDLRGEGLGEAHGLKLGVRGEGKRSVQGRKGEGRIDEVAGYWWWEVGWG